MNYAGAKQVCDKIGVLQMNTSSNTKRWWEIMLETYKETVSTNESAKEGKKRADMLGWKDLGKTVDSLKKWIKRYYWKKGGLKDTKTEPRHANKIRHYKLT